MFGYWIQNLMQLTFFFVMPMLVFLILFVLYNNFYAKDSKKPRLIILYSKTMIWALSFALILFSAKIGDDMIDQQKQSIDQEIYLTQNYYLDMYQCNQKFGNYDWESNLTEEQREECREEQREREKKFTENNKKHIINKSIYRISFLAFLLLIHVGIFLVNKRKED